MVNNKTILLKMLCLLTLSLFSFKLIVHAEGIKPEINIIGEVSDSDYYNSAKLNVVDTDSSSVTIKINGNIVQNGYTFNTDGVYTIIAEDESGNTTQRVITYDATKPSISGVTEGSILSNNVTLQFSDSVAGISNVKVNNVSQSKSNFSSYTTTRSGNYKIDVIDKAGNVASVSFIIDLEGPTTNIKNDGFYRESFNFYINSTVGIVDSSLTWKTIDNKIFTDTIAAGSTTYRVGNSEFLKKVGQTKIDGSYTVTIKDKANKTITYNFIVDTTKPILLNTSDNKEIKSGSIFETPVTIKGSDLYISKLICNDEEVESIKCEDGNYICTIEDKAGNINVISFIVKSNKTTEVVDKFIKISGIKNKKAYKSNVQFSATSKTTAKIVSVKIDNVEQIEYETVKKNGKEVTRQKSYVYKLVKLKKNIKDKEKAKLLKEKEGNHTIVVKDSDGHTLTYTIILDRTKPTITGVANKRKYSEKVTVWASDSLSGISKVYVNGKRIKKAKTITKKGTYKVKAIDKAGNAKSITFIMKKTVK